MNPLSPEEIKTFEIWGQKVSAVKEAKAILNASKYNAHYNKEFKERTKELDKRRNENILDLDNRFEDIMNEG